MAFPAEWLQKTVYTSTELQVLASVVLLVVLLGGVWSLRRFKVVLRDRYHRDIAEIIEMALMATGVVLTAYLLAGVWAMTFAFDRVLTVLMIDRWTGAQQVATLATLVAAYMLVRVITRSADRLWQEGALTDHQKDITYHIAYLGVFGIAGLIILSVWRVDITNVLVGAGVLSAVFGLAARKTVAAIIAGFVLLFAHPFHVGDWIKISSGSGDEESGIVQDVTLFHTRIHTFNDEHMLIANDEVISNRLINYSRNERLRIDVEVGVDYETDLDHAQEVIGEAIRDLDLVAESPEPEVVGKQFGDSAIVLELQFWIERPDRRRAWRARTAAIEAVKVAFDQEGITIPFPQRTHVARNDGFTLKAPSQSPANTRDFADIVEHE